MRLKDFIQTMAGITGWRMAFPRCIRHDGDGFARFAFCPITAVYHAKTGTRWEEGQARMAAHRLGIPYPAAIINAADGDPRFPGDHDYSNVEQLRTLLLKAARL